MRIGVKFFGSVDAVGTENIQTKFFILGLPLIPLESFYCLESGFRSVRGFPIAMNRKSILVAYLFWWIAFPLILAGCILFFVNDREIQYLLLTLLGLIVGFAINRMARLDSAERHRRTIFKNIAGIGAPPELLPPELLQKTLLLLEELWQSRISDSSLRDWRNIVSLDSFELDSLLILYCLASYARESSMASEVWKRIGAGSERETSKI